MIHYRSILLYATLHSLAPSLEGQFTGADQGSPAGSDAYSQVPASPTRQEFNGHTAHCQDQLSAFWSFVSEQTPMVHTMARILVAQKPHKSSADDTNELRRLMSSSSQQSSLPAENRSEAYQKLEARMQGSESAQAQMHMQYTELLSQIQALSQKVEYIPSQLQSTLTSEVASQQTGLLGQIQALSQQVQSMSSEISVLIRQNEQLSFRVKELESQRTEAATTQIGTGFFMAPAHTTATVATEGPIFPVSEQQAVTESMSVFTPLGSTGDQTLAHPQPLDVQPQALVSTEALGFASQAHQAFISTAVLDVTPAVQTTLPEPTPVPVRPLTRSEIQDQRNAEIRAAAQAKKEAAAAEAAIRKAEREAEMAAKKAEREAEMAAKKAEREAAAAELAATKKARLEAAEAAKREKAAADAEAKKAAVPGALASIGATSFMDSVLEDVTGRHGARTTKLSGTGSSATYQQKSAVSSVGSTLGHVVGGAIAHAAGGNLIQLASGVKHHSSPHHTVTSHASSIAKHVSPVHHITSGHSTTHAHTAKAAGSALVGLFK